jgi:single-stranded-DNA-specific exonuclease
VTATVLLVKVLRRIGAVCDYYLPNRLTEGYGMSIKGVDEIRRRGGTLIISVDCGVTASEEVRRASEAGMDVIITDHHVAHRGLPDAVAVLDPKVEGCLYPDRNLAGVGVALKLCQALAQAKGLDRSLWLDYLDIVSIGTAADIVHLVGENRVIAKIGFERLADTGNIGLQKLVSLQQLGGRPLSTGDIVFYLAPCINAAGRLGDSLRGVKLLLSEDEAEASLYARELVEMNRDRKALDKYVQDQAAEWVLNNVDLQKEYAIVAGGNDWHAGVIGIAASKIVERFCRPAFLFSIDDDGTARGSGRSVKGLHLMKALEECSDLLEGFGGHEAAAGAHIKEEKLPLFRERFNRAVGSQISMDDMVPRVFADAEVDLGGMNAAFFNTIKKMEPYGPGNMRPVLLCEGVSNRYEPRIVGKNHLKMTVEKDGLVMDAIAFNFGGRLGEVREAEKFSLAFSLDENTYGGRKTLQMRVKGVET